MSDFTRASRRRALASLGGLAALAAPPGLARAAAARIADTRFERVDLAAPPPAALRDALAPFDGRAVLVNFWASWCEPCRIEMPSLVNFDEAESGLALVTVAVADRVGDVRRFFDDHLLDPPVVADPDQVVARAWDVRYLPTTLLLDRTHRPRFRVRGELDWNLAAVRREVLALAAGDSAPHRSGHPS